MKGFCFLAILLISIGAGVANAQDDVAMSDRNPERRGIRRLKEEEIRALSSARKKGPGYQLDLRRSIFVTDLAILQLFTFEEVMAKLASGSGTKGFTKEQLFQQWWDTANPKSVFNLSFGGANCTAGGQLNNFPFTCPRNEGQQAIQNPFGPATDATYTAIALSNRFDLTTPPAKGGGDCGEYRIVFERNSGKNSPTNRNLIIFEAVLPNPKDDHHTLKGCRPIQEFWEGLSDPKLTVAKRGKMLHDLYFKGLPKRHVPPVIRAQNYGNAAPHAAGQIRTNQFMSGPNPQTWMLRQFHIVKDAQGLRILPEVVATNPAASLFDETIAGATGVDFRKSFLGQIAALAPTSANCTLPSLADCISLETAIQSDNGESEENATGALNSPAMDYSAAFANSPNFRTQIAAALNGSTLKPEDIVKRAQTQSCAGCHHISVNAALGGGLTWPSTVPPPAPAPSTLAFTHEQLASPESGPEGARYQISPALSDVFLPAREKIIRAFLEGPVH